MLPRPRRTFLGAMTLALAFAAVAIGLGSLGPIRGAVSWALVPLFSAAGRAADGFRGWSFGDRLETLERERVGLLAEIARREEFRRENELLSAALTLRREGEVGVMPANVIGLTREGRDEFLILDRGTAEGIGVGDLVIDKNRVLGGTVVEVSPRLSRAILLTSASRSIDAVIPTANLRAIARGANAGELLIELVPSGADLKPGDLVTASPRSTGGRRGLLVGRIRAVKQSEQETFKSVKAVHLFDSTGDGVLVLLAP